MPYVKQFTGMVDTGVTLEHHYVDDQDQPAVYHYPEQTDAFDIVWETPWQPEHAPVGSVVRWSSTFDDHMHEAKVIAHELNGIRSWVLITDGVCPFGRSHASFNGSHLKEVVSRGTGGMNWLNNTRSIADITNEYLEQQSCFKGRKHKNQYVGRRPESIIRYLLTVHPAFRSYYDGDHCPALSGDIYLRVKDAFTIVSDGYTSAPQCSANKKKLIAALKRVLPRMRVSKDKMEREERKFIASMY